MSTYRKRASRPFTKSSGPRSPFAMVPAEWWTCTAYRTLPKSGAFVLGMLIAEYLKQGRNQARGLKLPYAQAIEAGMSSVKEVTRGIKAVTDRGVVTIIDPGNSRGIHSPALYRVELFDNALSDGKRGWVTWKPGESYGQKSPQNYGQKSPPFTRRNGQKSPQNYGQKSPQSYGQKSPHSSLHPAPADAIAGAPAGAMASVKAQREDTERGAGRAIARRAAADAARRRNGATPLKGSKGRKSSKKADNPKGGASPAAAARVAPDKRLIQGEPAAGAAAPPAPAAQTVEIATDTRAFIESLQRSGRPLTLEFVLANFGAPGPGGRSLTWAEFLASNPTPRDVDFRLRNRARVLAG